MSSAQLYGAINGRVLSKRLSGFHGHRASHTRPFIPIHTVTDEPVGE